MDVDVEVYLLFVVDLIRVGDVDVYLLVVVVDLVRAGDVEVYLLVVVVNLV